MNSSISNESHTSKNSTVRKPSFYDKITNKIKNKVFFIHYHLLHNQFQSFWIEVCVNIIQTFQILCFSFNLRFQKYWTPINAFKIANHFLEYFQLGAFVQGRTEEFFIFFFSCIGIIIIVFSLEVLMLFRFNEKHSAFHIITNILQKIMFAISTVFYIPIIKILIGVIRCKQNTSLDIENSKKFYLYYANQFECYRGLHYFYISISLVFILCFIIKTIVFSSLYFETYYNKYNPIGQSTAKHKVYVKITTFICLFIFDFCEGFFLSELITMLLCIFMFACSLYSYYHYNSLKPNYNQTITKLEICLKLIILWCNFCLVFQRFVGYYYNYNFSILLFCLGIPLMLLVIISKKRNDLNYLINLSNKQTCSKDYANIAILLLNQIDHIDKRSSQLVIKSYAFCIEKTCILKECPLNKYIDSMNNKDESIIFILKHIETVFQNGIKKYPYCIFLRICYCRFLIERMNKRQFAFKQFQSLSAFSQTFEEQFIIYRYKKIFEETGTYNFEELSFNNNSFISFHYMNDRFRKNLSNVSLLYIEFWTLLYQSHLENQQNLSSLNDIGSKIHKQVSEINSLYLRIHQIVHDDKEFINLYYDFLSDVLHNTVKANKMKIILDELDMQENENIDIDLNNLEYQTVNKSDHYLYMLINAQYEDLGRIDNISLSLCSFFGYTKEELCGKSINILLPNIIQKGHHSLLKNKVDLFIKNGCEMKCTKPEYSEVNSYALTKAKYLISFNFKHCLLHTENQENYWLIKVSNEHKEIPMNTHKTSYIITDNNMTIQYFTGNSINLLGLNSFVFSTKIDITRNIKELHEELFLKLIELEDKSFEAKSILKQTLVKTKYKTPMMITWIRKFSTFDTNEYNESNQRNQSFERSPVLEPYSIHKRELKTATFQNLKNVCYLSVSEITFLNQTFGFIFKIEQYCDPVGNVSISYKHKILDINADPSKKSSYTSIDPKGYDGEKVKIDKNYLPQTLNGFNFNPSKMSYTINNEFKANQKDLVDYVKKEALIKLKANHSQSDSSDFDESKNYYSDDVSSDENNSNEDNSSVETNKRKELIQAQITNPNDEYYKVDFSKIRLSVINYKNQQYNDEKYISISKVQETIEATMPQNYSTKENKYNDKTTKRACSFINSKISHIIDDEATKNSIIRQIEKAIRNKDSQKSIIKMTCISLIVFFIIIANNIIFLLTSLYLTNTLIHNINRLQASFNLIQLSLSGMFYIRELILVNFNKYDIVYQPKKQYRQSIINDLTSVFLNMTEILDHLAETANELSWEDYNLIYNNFFPVEIIETDQRIFSYNLSLLSSMNKLSTSLYQIIQIKPEELYPLHPEVFFFTRNIINHPFLFLSKQSEVYKHILDERIKEVKKYAVIIFSVSNLCTLFCYYFIIKFYDEVIQKKESYLEVFYEIRSSVILASLNQCTKFVQKIQNPQDINYKNSTEYESYTEDEEFSVEQNVDKKHNSQQRNMKKKFQEVTQKIFFLMILLVVILLASISLIIFYVSLDNLVTCISFYVIEHQLQTNFISGFNILREYVFDKKSKVLGHDIELTVQSMYNKYIKTMQQLEGDIEIYYTNSKKEYLEKYISVKYQNICNYSQPFHDQFPSINFGLKPDLLVNSCDYGIAIVLSTFASQMNDMKNIFLNFVRNFDGIFTSQNLTLITPSDLIDQEELKNNTQILVFAHSRSIELNIVMEYLIYPVFIDLNDAIKREIKNIFDYLIFNLVVLLVSFSVAEIFWFAIKWRYYISSLNKVIYKAKNMLTIIPFEILISLSSIYKLLQIKITTIIPQDQSTTKKDAEQS